MWVGGGTVDVFFLRPCLTTADHPPSLVSVDRTPKQRQPTGMLLDNSLEVCIAYAKEIVQNLEDLNGTEDADELFDLHGDALELAALLKLLAIKEQNTTPV